LQSIGNDSSIRIRSDYKRTLLLNGFGISIKVLDKRLIITNGKDRLYPDNQYQRILLTDHADFDKIVIVGTGAISFNALQWLTEWNINVIMLDGRGRLYGSFNQISGNTEPLIRMKQYECFMNDTARQDYLRKWIVSSKITAQIMLMRELEFDTEYMEKQYALLNTLSKNTLRKISAIESHVSKAYYSNLAILFDRINPELGFKTRINPMTMRKNEATDIINALLNYGFAILQSEVGKQLNALGLDCDVGFLHVNHDNHVPLIWDMMEPFRYLIDKSVIALVKSNNGNGINTKQDYCFRIGNPSYPFKSGSPFNRWLIVSSDLKKRYVAMLTAILQSKRYQRTDKSGMKTDEGYQKMEEITIMKIKCIELRDYIIGRRKTLSQPPEILLE